MQSINSSFVPILQMKKLRFSELSVLLDHTASKLWSKYWTYLFLPTSPKISSLKCLICQVQNAELNNDLKFSLWQDFMEF